MRIKLLNRFALIESISDKELTLLKKTLSWGDIPKNWDPLVVPFGELVKTGQFNTLLLTAKGKLYLYSGLIHYLKDIFNIEFSDEDIESLKPDFSKERVDPDILPGITLRDYQVSAINKALLWKSGIIQSATGSGKSEIMISLIQHMLKYGYAENICIVVPGISLLDNLAKRFSDYGFENVTYLSAELNPDPNKKVLIANIASLKNALKSSGELYDRLKSTDLLIFDEAHHCRAATFFESAMQINPKYLYGFSGTPFQNEEVFEDFEDVIVRGLFGRVIININTRFLIEKGHLAKFFVLMKPCGKPGKFLNMNWKTVRDNYIIKNKFRNASIKNYAELFVKLGLSVLIIVDSLAHQDILLKLLKKQKVAAVKGSKIGKIVDQLTGLIHEFDTTYQEMWDALANGTHDIVISNFVSDEGVDIPSVNVIILAAGGKSHIKVNQRGGRGLRSKKNRPNEFYLLDFLDNRHAYVRNHSNLRKNHYLESGAVILNEQDFVDKIYQHSKEAENMNK